MSETFEEWAKSHQVDNPYYCGKGDRHEAAKVSFWALHVDGMREVYADKLGYVWSHQQQKIDKLERDNEVLKEALRKIYNNPACAEYHADKALSKIRSEG